MTKLEQLNEDNANLKKAMELIINLNSIKTGSALDEKAKQAYVALDIIRQRINNLFVDNLKTTIKF